MKHLAVMLHRQACQGSACRTCADTSMTAPFHALQLPWTAAEKLKAGQRICCINEQVEHMDRKTLIPLDTQTWCCCALNMHQVSCCSDMPSTLT